MIRAACGFLLLGSCTVRGVEAFPAPESGVYTAEVTFDPDINDATVVWDGETVIVTYQTAAGVNVTVEYAVDE